jgi:hypothetical protein
MQQLNMSKLSISPVVVFFFLEAIKKKTFLGKFHFCIVNSFTTGKSIFSVLNMRFSYLHFLDNIFIRNNSISKHKYLWNIYICIFQQISSVFQRWQDRAMRQLPETVFLTFMEPRNRFQGIDSASLCRLSPNL